MRVRAAGPRPHRATTATLRAAYPFVACSGLGAAGTYLGRDLHGGVFCFDPWELYRTGALTSPNLLVVGQIGRGKSTFVKVFVWRQLVFGRQAWIIDPKGEYGPLATACGSVPLALRPGGPLRLNPLDAGLGAPTAAARAGEPGRPPGEVPAEAGSPPGTGPAEPDGDVVRRRAELLCSLAGASLGRVLSPAERTSTELATRAVSARLPSPTLPDVVGALLEPDPALAATVRTDAAGLAADGRIVALELRRLVEGDLAGMFDSATTPGIDLSGAVVVLDLSHLYDSPALGLLMTCAAAWLQGALRRADGVKRLVVVDEAWAILHDPSTARWLQAGFKLSRAFGVANVAVVHRLSDLRVAEAGGAHRLAEGLLADSETRVIFAQPPSELAPARDLLGLTGTEAEVLGHLPRGVALWKVGDRSFLVEHDLGAREAALVDTDAAMLAAPAAPAAPAVPGAPAAPGASGGLGE